MDDVGEEQGVEYIFHLRKLHKIMDNTVLEAYGWTDIDLAHGFYEMDYLPENDCTRYTISPDARKEILKRLLQLNHEIHAEELVAISKEADKEIGRARKRKSNKNQLSLLDTLKEKERPETRAQVSQINYSNFPDNEWVKTGLIKEEDFGVCLAAIIKFMKKPMPTKWVRLAVIFSLEPRLLTPLLSNEESALWNRLVGAKANIRQANVQDIIPLANRGWGIAVQTLRGNGFIVEDLDAGTWEPGKKIEESFSTEGWPDGRAQFVLNYLNQRNIDEFIGDMPDTIQEWINAKAA